MSGTTARKILRAKGQRSRSLGRKHENRCSQVVRPSVRSSVTKWWNEFH